MHFEYSETEINYLKKQDEKLAFYIDKIGMLQREINPNIFENFINQIIGQQISNKAYATVSGRIKNLLKEITPTNILKYDDDTLQQCGLSFRKVSYMKNIANFWQENKNLDLQNLSNEEIIKTLTEIKGVGIWTVEMLLLFSLQRKDVLSYNDLVIRNSLMKLHNLESLTKKDFVKYKELYSPYGSIASLYLWELNNIL